MSFSESMDHFATQTVPKAAITVKFFFSETFVNQHFQEVELNQGKPQPGDLFLFELQTPKAQYFGLHVGVYCGNGEIIHFEGRASKFGIGGVLQSLLEHGEGKVCKEGLRALKQSRKLSRVLRKRDGVDAKDLDRRVKEAMDDDSPQYNVINSNCMHFALRLLGMDSTLIGTSCNFQFYPGKSTSQPFQEVELDKGAPKSGDLCLFKLQSPKEQSFKPHVGVYCGNGEIIHLDAIPTGRASIWGGLQSLLGYLGYGGGGEGVVCKEDLGALRSSGHLLHVLRQCDDVKPEELERRKQIAVNSKPPPYNDITSNCVHFALRLLGMDYK